MANDAPDYLEPYLIAARTHRGGFGSLMWASQATQRARFAALVRLYEFAGRRILDVGAGRGDLLTFLQSRRIEPGEYIAVEAVADLADALEHRHAGRCTVVRADFVRDPARLFVGADVIVFSGSLNTLAPPAFYQTLRHAYDAAGDCLIFNFLADPSIAAARYLHWYGARDVEAFVQRLSRNVRRLDDYLDGDCTFCLCKQ